MSTAVSLQDAYETACQALGESVVRERLMLREIERLTEPQEEAK